jgi:Arylsulfotransferase (ASST)
MAVTPDPPANVLSARVSFTATTAPDSVRVSFQENGGPSQTTPFRAGKLGTDTINVFGLKASTTYQYQVDAFSGGALRSSSSSTFRTDDLPADLSAISMEKISGSASYYAATGVQTASGGYAVVFDTAGAIVWYHDFVNTGLEVSDVMMQPNGNFTAFIGNTSGSQPLEGYYVEFTPAGQEVHTYHAPSGYYMDDHEIKLTGSGTTKKATYITYDIRTLDLTEIGGLPSVATAGHQIVREDATGAREFTWDAWTNLGIDEWLGDDGTKSTRTATDFDHPNGISFDADGNYVVSWRNLDQIMAINSQTGDVMWRIGGAKGDYQFVNDPLGGFTKQHSPKMLPNGNLLVLDNGTGHDPQETRAVEYRLDHTAKTATLVWEYHHDPPIFTAFVGWVERLASGNTWVGFALAGRVVEVDPAGNVVWESQLKVNGANGSVYRLLPIVSLYGFATP